MKAYKEMLLVSPIEQEKVSPGGLTLPRNYHDCQKWMVLGVGSDVEGIAVGQVVLTVGATPYSVEEGKKVIHSGSVVAVI